MKATRTIAAVVTSGALTLAASALAQGNVQNVQVVGPTPSPSNLQPFSAVSTPVDTVTAPASTSGSTLGALIALPQNSSAPAISANPATPAPAISATPFVPTDTFQVRFTTKPAVNDSVVNITHAPSPAPSASSAPANVPIQAPPVNQGSPTANTGTVPLTPGKNASIQRPQANQAAVPLTTRIPPTRNIIIKNSRANTNNPAATLPDKGKTAGPIIREFNRRRKIENKDRSEEGDDQGQHLHRKMLLADPQPQGAHHRKWKAEPSATPQ